MKIIVLPKRYAVIYDKKHSTENDEITLTLNIYKTLPLAIANDITTITEKPKRVKCPVQGNDPVSPNQYAETIAGQEGGVVEDV